MWIYEQHRDPICRQPMNRSIELKDLIVLNDLLDQSIKGSVRRKDSIKETADVAKLPWKQRLAVAGSRCCNLLCVWECCSSWVSFQKLLHGIVFDPFAEVFILFCILANTLLMAVDHYGMSQAFEQFLKSANYFFTSTFTIEAALKLLVLSPKKYFADRWHLFDFIIVALSLMELMLSGIKGLSVLRTFRLLRVFRLARNWSTLNMLITIMGRTVGAIGNLTLVLCIIVFIFAVMGMQLFGNNYIVNKNLLPSRRTPRWNFTDFLHSGMIVFRVLCGEWIESMWTCIKLDNSLCVPYFLATVVIANLVVLSLFLALLLSSFGASNLSVRVSSEAEISNMTKAMRRLTRTWSWLWRRVTAALGRVLYCSTCRCEHHSRGSLQIEGTNRKSNHLECSVQTTSCRVLDSSAVHTTSIADSQPCTMALTQQVYSDAHGSSTVVISTPTEATLQAPVDEHATDDKLADCCPPLFYRLCPGCKSRSRGQPASRTSTLNRFWRVLRLRTFQLTENKYFESVVIFMIILSSLSLAMEDIHLKDKPLLKDILFYMDYVFTVTFIAEMIVKWLAMGFHKYFTNAWCWLDFLIVMVSIVSWVAKAARVEGVGIFKTMRTLRALRPLRAMSRMQGMKVVVNALIQAIPSIFNVFLVCIIFWLIFAILGVQLFGGKYFKCLDENGTRLHHTIVANVSQCDQHATFTWNNSLMHFDHVGAAYLSLFQVATFKGWMPIIADATDIGKVGEQPRYEANVYMNLYFVVFIICGAFFTLNLFIGVIIDNFNEQKKKIRASLDLFMTEDQRKYYVAMKKMRKKKPQKAIPRPHFHWQAIIYDICMDRKFDIVIMLFIGLNMIVMTMDEYQMSQQKTDILQGLNFFFIAVFTAECALKLFSLRWYYFKDSWNLFDFGVVVLSILGIVLKDIFTKIFNVPPTLLRVVRVAKVTRVLRLIKSAKGIRTLLFAFAMSAPALLNIIMLLFLVMFIYAIFGMSFFMHVKLPVGGLDDTFNFQTFVKSFALLFQMMTSAGWDGVLEGITNERDCLPPDPETGHPGNCGNTVLGICYLLSYLFISFLIVINMYIAVILENYSQAKDDVEEGLTGDDYDMYYEIWQHYDPKGTKFIALNKLSSLLSDLEHPLQIPEPNKFKIIAMDIIICKGDRVCCVDILDAITKDFFIRKGTKVHETDIKNTTPQRDIAGYTPISSTMLRCQEEHCARLIQRAWHRYVEQAKRIKQLES